MEETVAKVVFKDEGQVFLSLAKTLQSLDMQMPMFFDKSKLVIQAIDPAHIAMLRTIFPKKWFEEWKYYTGFKDEERELSVEPDTMKQILSKAKKKDKISIAYAVERGKDLERCLNVTVENNRYKKEYKIEASNIMDRAKYPKINLNTEVEMNTGDFVDHVKEISEYCDTIAITVDKGVFTMESYCDGDSIRITPEADILKFDMYAQAKYPADYLTKLLPFVKIHDKMRIEFRSDYPLHIYLEKEGIKTDFLLAPRMSD